MSDNATNIPAATPQPWLVQASEEQVARQMEIAALARQRADEDEMRAAAPTIVLTAITGFTIVSGEFPKGKVISMGEEFVISTFDLPKYIGKGLPTAPTAPKPPVGA